MLKYITILFFQIVSAVAWAQKQPVTISPEKGKMLATKCMDCHNDTLTALAGPLWGIRKIRTTRYIYSLLKNPMQFAEKNNTAKKAFAKRGLQMPPFPNLTRAEIKAILDYFDSIPKSKKD